MVRATAKTDNDYVVKIIFTAEPGAEARAKREITLLQMFQKLKDPRARHICGIGDTNVTVSCSAMVLECMELGTVQDVLAHAVPDQTITDPAVAGGATRLRLQSIAHLCLDVLAGLAVMHASSPPGPTERPPVCHRDIKPANIGISYMPWLNRVGYKIIDLGIAVAETARDPGHPSSSSTPPSSEAAAAAVPAHAPRSFMTGICTSVTELKRLRGTTMFMSPEQLDPKKTVRLHTESCFVLYCVCHVLEDRNIDYISMGVFPIATGDLRDRYFQFWSHPFFLRHRCIPIL